MVKNGNVTLIILFFVFFFVLVALATGCEFFCELSSGFSLAHQTRLPKHDGLRMRGIPKTSENPKGAKTRLQIATSKQ